MKTKKSVWSRRRLLKGVALGPLASQLSPTQDAVAAVKAGGSIYEELGVRTLINGQGVVTFYSCTLMPPEAHRAMERASEHYVEIVELQRAVGARLAKFVGTEAAMAGYRVKYTLATQLANELVEAADEMTLAKTIARYGRVDLLCIDELGYMQLDRRGAELLFQVLTEREEKASVAIASNESFGGWTKTFTDPRLCAAIVDRLTFGGTILETGTDSYRLAQATKQRTT